MSSAVVEIQYFLGNENEIIVKELCCLKNGKKIFYLFENPFDWEKLSKEKQKCNLYAIRYLHKLEWLSGTEDLKDLNKIIKSFCEDVSKVYVKGRTKSVWLSSILFDKEIIDADEILSIKLNDLKLGKNSFCPYHKSLFCAKKNCENLFEWLKENKKI